MAFLRLGIIGLGALGHDRTHERALLGQAAPVGLIRHARGVHAGNVDCAGLPVLAGLEIVDLDAFLEDRVRHVLHRALLSRAEQLAERGQRIRALADQAERPGDLEYRGRVGREDHGIAAVEQLHHDIHEGADGTRVEPHLGFLDDDLLDILVLALRGGGQEAIESQHEGGELPLPRGPGRHRQRDLRGRLQHEALARVLLVEAQGRPAVHAPRERILERLAQALRVREEPARRIARVGLVQILEQLLAELPDDVGEGALVALETTRPAVVEGHDALGGNVEDRMLALGDRRMLDILIAQRLGARSDEAVVRPDGGHALAQVVGYEHLAAPRGIVGEIDHRLLDRGILLGELEHLQGDTLARGLRPDEYGEVAELHVGSVYGAEVLQHETHHDRLLYHPSRIKSRIVLFVQTVDIVCLLPNQD